MNRLLLILLSIFATPAAAAGPVIWGPNGSAPMLNAGPLVTNDGRSIQTPGAINFAKNTNATTNLSGITDLGTGTTSSRTTTTSEISAYPWYQTAIKLTNAGSGTGSTRIVCFQLPAAYKSTKLGVSWLQIPGAGYVAGDYTVDVYSDTSSDCNGTETRLTLSTDSSSSITALPASTQPFKTTFDSTTADYYEVRITRAAGSSGATSWLAFNEFYVGPGITAQGAVVGDWQSFTPTLTASGGGSVSIGTGTTALASGKYRRVGSDMEAMVTWRWGNTSTAFGTSGFYALALPGGLTLNQSALPYTSTSTDSILGQGYYYDSDVTDFYPLAVSPSFTTGLIYFPITTSLSAASLGTTAPVTIANGDEIVVRLTAPIAEWAGSGTVNVGQNDVVYYSHDGTSLVYGPNGSLVPNVASSTGETDRTITIPAPSPSKSYWLEVNYRGLGWAKASDQFPWMIGNNGSVNNRYGMSGGWASATTYTTGFGNQGTYIQSSAVSAGNVSWATEFGAGTRWRLVEAAQGQAVGFGNVAQSSSGLVKSAGQLLGTNTNDVAATGYVGELVQSSRTRGSNTAISSGVDANVLSTPLPLTAGDWTVCGSVGFIPAATTSATIWQWGVGLTSATMPSTKGAVPSGNEWTGTFRQAAAVPGGGDEVFTVPCIPVTLSATTSLYLVVNATFTTSTMATWGSLWARRVR